MKKILLQLVFALAMTNAFGANCYWTGGVSGAWNTATNWSTTSGGSGDGAVPGVSDVAIFDALSGSPSVDITGLAVTVDQLTLQGGSTSTVTLTGAATSFTVNTTLNLASGTLSLTGTTLTMANGSTITCSGGSLAAAPNLGTAPTDLVNVTITGANPITSGNEILSNSPGKYGLLTIMSTAVYSFSPSITQTATTADGSATVTLTAPHPGILAGMYVSGTGIPAGVTVVSVSGTILTLSSGTGVTAGSTTLTFKRCSSTTVSTASSASTTLNVASKAEILTGMTVIGAGISGTVKVSSVSSTQSAVTLSAAQTVAEGTTVYFVYDAVPFYTGLNLSGSSPFALTMTSGAIIFPNGSTITHSNRGTLKNSAGVGAFQIGFTAANGGQATDRVNLVISGAGGLSASSINAPIGTNSVYGVPGAGYGSLSVTNGTWNIGCTPTLYSGVSISSGATLKGLSGYGLYLAGGNWSDDGTFNASGTTFFVQFKGTNQTISNSTGNAETFSALAINTPTTSTTTANCSINVTGALTLTAGNLALGANNLTVGSLTGGSATSYIVTNGAGTFTLPLAAATAKLIPIGDAASSYDPATLTPTNATSISAKVSSTLSGTAVYGTKYNTYEWQLIPTSGSSTTVSLTPSSLDSKVAANNATPIIGIYNQVSSVYTNYFSPAVSFNNGAYSGVFDLSQSSSRNFVTGANIDVTAVQNANETMQSTIYTVNNGIIIENAQGENIHVYSVTGALVRSFNGNADKVSVALGKGIYVVKYGMKVAKVVVN